MSDERTQAPSKLRLQQAREQGQAAHSPELTAAAALFAASIALGLLGGSAVEGMLRLFRASLDSDGGAPLAIDEFPGLVIGAFAQVGIPLMGILLTPPLAAAAAHQAQVRGLFAPALIAPNFARLAGGHAEGMGARLGRGAWTLAKAAVFVLVAVWTLASGRETLFNLAGMEVAALAAVWASSLVRTTATLGLASLALGLVDFELRRRRFEALLRLTPAEAREDMKAAEGDPALRARRSRVARSWRGDAPELLAGASLAVVGERGLIAILSGGPPPRRVHVRSTAKGATGAGLLRAAEREKLPVVENDALARRLALLRAPAPSAELTAELKAVWPVA